MDPLTAMPGTRLRKCAICERFYEPTNSRSLGCSDACRAENRKRKHTERQREARRADRTEYHRIYYANSNWPKCGDCGHIARKVPDVGCLECYARSQPRRRWTDDERETIEYHAGKGGPATLQSQIYKQTGYARSRDSIWYQMKSMGIRTTDHQDGYTIPQLMKITGRPYSTIHRLIRDDMYENIGSRRRVLISIEDGEKLIERYKKSQRPSYSRKEAADLLGIDISAIKKAMDKGLPSWKEGVNRRVCKVTIDRAAAYLRKTGKLRIHWRLLMQAG